MRGLGRYVPSKILTNLELEEMVDTSHDWIVTRTGIHERRIASMEEASSHLGREAARKAIEKAGIDKSQIDMIICATMTPDYITPSTAALIQQELGLPRCPAFDIQAACTGFIYALSQAKAFIESGLYKNVLIIATEKMSAVIDYEDRNTCVLFGDGAAAAIVSGEGSGFLIPTVQLGADGDQSHLILIPGGGSRMPASEASVKARDHFVKMEGREVFKHAVRRMTAAVQNCLKENGMKEEDIAWLIPHQANKRIIESIASQFNIPDAQIFMTLHKYGNTSGSSVGIALSELEEEVELKSGDNLLLVAFGAGLTWGATILTYQES
ncbi:MAG: ketoacyl-ACP synthase III [Chlamydiia bacterium]|nr:ketoacyl-ACP synthase III [Chlamydiia bacterium]